MEETKKKNVLKIGITDILLSVLSLCFFLGMLLFFGPCKSMADHGYMSCHYAGVALKVYAAVILGDAILHFMPIRGVKMGISIAILPVLAATVITPGKLIPLCTMQDMRCQAVMQPAALVGAMLIAAAAIADILMQCVHLRKEAGKQ